jgi:hypothetical protein
VANETHGIIAAPSDQSTGIVWWNGSYTETGATGTALGTGQANTTAIVNSQGTRSYAASLCDDLVLGGYSDWYLPSKDELNKLYQNIGQGNALGLGDNVGGFAPEPYWSSSELNNGSVWFQRFTDGTGGDLNKDDSYPFVRAVRTF